MTQKHGNSQRFHPPPSDLLQGHAPKQSRRRPGCAVSATAAVPAPEVKNPNIAIKPQLRVLLVEDNPGDRDLILHELGKIEFDVTSDAVQTAKEFRQRIKTNPPDVVLADYNLGQWRGIEALEILRAEGLDIPLILVSGALGAVTAVECIKQGVTDYVLKDSLARLSVALRGALKDKEARQERNRNQQALAEKVEELARSNADLEQFAYVASHDLQEPLRMVSAYTQLLAERYRGRLDEQADKYISYAVDGAARMQSLIRDLLAFSRVGRQETAVRSTDCNEIVAQATRDLQAAIQESGAVVTHGHLPRLLASSSQLKQVFQNLIGNGLKFRRSEAPVIHISAKKQGLEWIFDVADNSIGISAEHVESVFIIFNRLHTRTEYPGNGIGLAICKKIIERHGGTIQVVPNEGGGTIFRFTLPAGKLAQKQDPK
jgi:signal transduction histidine kinase